MKYRSVVLLTCVYTLSPTGSPAASPKGWAGTKHSASSSSVHNTKHSLATIPEAPAFATEDFPALTGRPIPTKPAKARAVAQPMAKGEPVVTSGNARAVSSVIDRSSVDKESLDAAAQKSTPQEIQILNDATGRVCDLDYGECERKLNEIACQIRKTYLHPSDRAQAFDNRAQNFKSLAREYNLIITLGTNDGDPQDTDYEDRQDTQRKFTRALGAAATELYNAAGSYSLLGKHIEEAARYTESAAVYKRCAEVCRELGQSRVEVGALKGAASALYYAARAHSAAGNDAAEAACHIESAEVYQSCAKVCRELGEDGEEADALKGAADALRSAAILHASAGNDATATALRTASADLYLSSAKVYGLLEVHAKKAVALQYAAEALSVAASSDTPAGNHADEANAHEKLADLYHKNKAVALKCAASALSFAASSDTPAGNHADEANAHEKRADLYQRCAELYCELEQSRERADALKGAASALHHAARAHSAVGKHSVAAARHTESAAVYQRCAELYYELEQSRERADALKGAASALYCAARAHSAAGNDADAIECYTASAALYQSSAEVYLVSGDGETQAEALLDAARALRNAARSHTNAGNHEAAEEATREGARLLTERKMILGA